MAEPPAAKRARTGGGAAGAKYLDGVKVFLPLKGIDFGPARAAIWRPQLEKAGAALVEERPHAPSPTGITHCVVGKGGLQGLPPALQPGASQPTTSGTGLPAAVAAPGAPAYVSVDWIQQCLRARQQLPAADFPPPEPEPEPAPAAAGAAGNLATSSLGSGAASGASLGSARGGSRGVKYRRWLGEEFWHDGCAGMSDNELALQAVYSEERSRGIGNEPLVQALKELACYERALWPDYFAEQSTSGGGGGRGGGRARGGGNKGFNYNALRYDRAASIVRACSYKLGPDVRAADLPFVGDWTAKEISEILRRGSCRTLDLFRADKPVSDSHSRTRQDTVGAATRARFFSLPCVGTATAKRWWDQGCRSFEDVEREAQPGGPLARGGQHPLTTAQRFSLEHRAYLLEGNTAEDVAEMREVVQAALEAVSFGGWRLEVVGGSRRSAANHDADFLATHPAESTEGVIGRLAEKLMADGRLFPPTQAMCQIQSGLLPNHIERLRQKHMAEGSDAPSRQTKDRFDHIYGMYRTKAGKVRRMDVVICPPDEWPFAVLGWVGSRQFLRFMRGFAKEQCGLFLSSHRLMRKVGGESKIVPDETQPQNRHKQPWWPPGWGAQRRVQSERDIFELLGLPFRDPHERDAP